MFWYLVGAVIIILLFLQMEWLKYPLRKLPGPPTIPILGNLIQVDTRPEGLFKVITQLVRQYGERVRFCLGPTILVIGLSNPDDVEVITNNTKTITKGIVYDGLRPWLGEGLLTSKGAHWHSHRKLLTPAFHFNILEKFIPVFVKNSEILVEKFETLMKNGPFDVYMANTLCSLDVIFESVMGVSLQVQKEENSSYTRYIKDITKSIIIKQLTLPYASSFIFNLSKTGKLLNNLIKIVHEFTFSIIETRKKENKISKSLETEEDEYFYSKKKLAFLDLLLDVNEKNPSFTLNDIREEADTFMFEGHDTTSSCISFAMYCIAKYPEVQRQIVEELDSIFQGSDQPITYKELCQMNYLERTIKEVLRLYPSVPLITRQSDEDIPLLDGVVIPKKTEIGIVIYMMHINPKYWPDPMKFDPDRFLPEKCQNRHPFSYIPFSAGSRNCIGQKFAMLEIKTILATVVRKFNLIDINHELILTYEVILKSKNGIFIKFEKRNNNNNNNNNKINNNNINNNNININNNNLDININNNIKNNNNKI